jgi:hypothetical protein
VSSTFLRGVSVGPFLALLPTAAYAVNVSSNDGSGTQSVTGWSGDTWAASDTLKSSAGNAVYFSGNRVYDSAPDYVCNANNEGRYTTNTASTSGVSKGGSCGAFGLFPGNVDGAQFRVCRDIQIVSDPCGSWSTTVRR